MTMHNKDTKGDEKVKDGRSREASNAQTRKARAKPLPPRETPKGRSTLGDVVNILETNLSAREGAEGLEADDLGDTLELAQALLHLVCEGGNLFGIFNFEERVARGTFEEDIEDLEGG